MARSVQAEVSRVILFELADPRMRFVTITRVEMSADLRIAKVFLSILGSETDVHLSFQAIRHAGRHIRRVLADRLEARYTPVLEFMLDPGVRKSVEISKLIGSVLADSPRPEAADSSQPSEPAPDKPKDGKLENEPT